MESALGPKNDISRRIVDDGAACDGRARYGRELRVTMYMRLLRVAREIRPDLQLALCLEDQAVWKSVNKEIRLGRCNCIL